VSDLAAGDPASVSATAAALTRAGSALAAEADALEAAYRDLGRTWTGRASVDVRRRGAALTAACSTTAAELQLVGTALQDLATDLAELVARARAVAERADADGLALQEGRVVLGYGIAGEADPARAQDRERGRAELQRELDTVRTLLQRRRQRLVELLASSTDALSEATSVLGTR